MKLSARRAARALAVQAVYSRLFSEATIGEIEAYCLSAGQYQKVDSDFFRAIFEGTIEKQNIIDETITPLLDRPFNELTPMELSILRVSTFELLFRPDVPYRVVINEALELTKMYGASEAFKFVNGVLDQVSKTCRQTERNA